MMKLSNPIPLADTVEPFGPYPETEAVESVSTEEAWQRSFAMAWKMISKAYVTDLYSCVVEEVTLEEVTSRLRPSAQFTAGRWF